MKFVLVPAGEFVLGSDEPPDVLSKAYPQYERRRAGELGDEAPVHRVRITQPFYLGQFEVSVGQFRKFLEASGYIPEPVADGTGAYGYNTDYDAVKSVSGDAFEGRDPKYSWHNPGFVQGDNHPVLNVTCPFSIQGTAFGIERDRRHKRHLVLGAPACLAASQFSAKVSVIRLDITTQRILGIPFDHRLYQFLLNQPSRGVTHAQLPLKVECR